MKEPYLKTATISNDGWYRYSLERLWDKEKETVMFIMLNPSTADAMKDDATIRRCVAFAKSFGYGELIVGNLFAYRSRDPDMMFYHMVCGENVIGPENDTHLIELSKRAHKIIFAWGAWKGIEERVQQVQNMFPNAYCLARSANGHPRHPLYLKSDSQPQLFTLPSEDKQP